MNLLNGDCLSMLPKLPEGSVDCVIADLPYGTTLAKWDQHIDIKALWAQIWRVLKPNGIVVMFGAQPFSSMLVASCPTFFKYEWVWEKSRATGMLTVQKQPMRNHESILIFYRKRGTYNRQMEKVENPRKNKTKMTEHSQEGLYGQFNYTGKKEVYEEKNPKTVLKFASVSNTNRLHSCQKPVDLLRYLIRTYTNPGEIVLDPSMGSGSTGEACLLEGRNFVGIEKDPKYFQISTDRLNNTIKEKTA